MKRAIKFFTRLCEAYLPDAFVFCLILTLVVFGLTVFLTPYPILELVEFWGKDFWSLNAFAMQMVFVLISGHMLATSPVINKLLFTLSSKVHSEKVALVVLSLFSMLACWLNWGFGLIVSGILAVMLAENLKKVNFGLFMAAAYGGFLVWHGGVSGSIPLKIAGKDEILSKVYPGLSIPLEQTVFSIQNLIILTLLFILMPILVLALRTDDKNEVSSPLKASVEMIVGASLRDRLENSRFFNITFFLFFSVLMYLGIKNGVGLDINRVNFIFLFLAFLFHGTPKRFLGALQESITYASGIIIQFPFYAGIMGLMQYSGLADIISSLFVSISTARTLPLWTFFSGGLVNFFVPSGGGQWVVQGPVVLKAAQDLGADPAKVSLALSWGDAWTNMVQPFWALPLLGLAKIELKDIMGYLIMIFLMSGIIISGVFFFF